LARSPRFGLPEQALKILHETDRTKFDQAELANELRLQIAMETDILVSLGRLKEASQYLTADCEGFPGYTDHIFQYAAAIGDYRTADRAYEQSYETFAGVLFLPTARKLEGILRNQMFVNPTMEVPQLTAALVGKIFLNLLDVLPCLDPVVLLQVLDIYK